MISASVAKTTSVKAMARYKTAHGPTKAKAATVVTVAVAANTQPACHRRLDLPSIMRSSHTPAWAPGDISGRVERSTPSRRYGAPCLPAEPLL